MKHFFTWNICKWLFERLLWRVPVRRWWWPERSRSLSAKRSSRCSSSPDSPEIQLKNDQSINQASSWVQLIYSCRYTTVENLRGPNFFLQNYWQGSWCQKFQGGSPTFGFYLNFINNLLTVIQFSGMGLFYIPLYPNLTHPEPPAPSVPLCQQKLFNKLFN